MAQFHRLPDAYGNAAWSVGGEMVRSPGGIWHRDLARPIWVPPLNLAPPDPDPEELLLTNHTWDIRNTQEVRDVGNSTSLVVFSGENIWNQVSGLDGVIKMKGTAPWEFRNCNFRFTSDMFRRFNPNTNGRFVNCRFLGVEASMDNTGCGRPYYMSQATNIEIYNCFFAYCNGVLIESPSGDGYFEYECSPNNRAVRYQRNFFYNVSKIWRNPEAATHYSQWRANPFQLLKCIMPNVVYGENLQVNRADVSSPEDNGNLFKSGGTPAAMMKVRGNCWYGSTRPLQFRTDADAGSGMIMDSDDPFMDDGVTPNPAGRDPATEPQYTEASYNYGLNCNNGTMNISAGHHNHYHHNTIYNSGEDSNGVKIDKAHAGVSVFDYHGKAKINPALFTENLIEFNRIACYHGDNTDWKTGFENRLDISNTGRAADWYHLVKDTIHFEDHEMSNARADGLFYEWRQNMADLGVVVGIDTAIGNAAV